MANEAIFRRAVAWVLGWEGEWARHPQDPGGITRWGISTRAYPDLDLSALSREDAIELYRRDYWEAIRGPDLPPALALVLFDTAVLFGVAGATRMLQRVVGVTADGRFGPITLRAAREHWARDPKGVLLPLLRSRAASIPPASPFAGGWWGRLLDLAVTAGAWLGPEAAG